MTRTRDMFLSGHDNLQLLLPQTGDRLYMRRNLRVYRSSHIQAGHEPNLERTKPTFKRNSHVLILTTRFRNSELSQLRRKENLFEGSELISDIHIQFLHYPVAAHAPVPDSFIHYITKYKNMFVIGIHLGQRLYQYPHCQLLCHLFMRYAFLFTFLTLLCQHSPLIFSYL